MPREYGLCEYCREKFETRYLLQSCDNVCYCKDCFKRKFCQGSGDQKRVKAKHCERKPQKMIPYPELYSSQRNHQVGLKTATPSMMSLSKRPLQCPKADCNKFVSLFTLESHFKYEHKEVPIILTQLDARSALEFYPRDVRYGVIQCIVLLNVINHDFSYIIPRTSCKESCSRTHLQYSAEPRPVMILLATRISACELAKQELVHDCMCEASETEVDSSKTFVQHDILLPDDKIIIWMASNICTNLNYTVAVSTLSNKIRQKYFGPMLTLGDSPIDLWREGSCLILTHFHINGMSENGVKPLALDVVIHSPD
ncbi:hypothetical protein NQ318_006448 [Aromia moschata]|uniref:DUF4729 domain-containing protein n=1 Tax=Aromia moschata TaxID=1265417 RepID=A0AAV8XQ38_9CUCU|nr:hypothetical protein NQ318_006448 [Aromia moschata]